MRRHDWILDVLSDLQDYALANGLVDLAVSVEVTLAVARHETESGQGSPSQRPARREQAH